MSSSQPAAPLAVVFTFSGGSRTSRERDVAQNIRFVVVERFVGVAMHRNVMM